MNLQLINKNTQRMAVDRSGLPCSKTPVLGAVFGICMSLPAAAFSINSSFITSALGLKTSVGQFCSGVTTYVNPFCSIEWAQISTSIYLSCDCLFIRMSPAVVCECQEDRDHFDPLWSLYYLMALNHGRYSIVARMIIDSYYTY